MDQELKDLDKELKKQQTELKSEINKLQADAKGTDPAKKKAANKKLSELTEAKKVLDTQIKSQVEAQTKLTKLTKAAVDERLKLQKEFEVEHLERLRTSARFDLEGASERIRFSAEGDSSKILLAAFPPDASDDSKFSVGDSTYKYTASESKSIDFKDRAEMARVAQMADYMRLEVGASGDSKEIDMEKMMKDLGYNVDNADSKTQFVADFNKMNGTDGFKLGLTELKDTDLTGIA